MTSGLKRGRADVDKTPAPGGAQCAAAHNAAGAKVGAHWTVQRLRAADKLEAGARTPRPAAWSAPGGPRCPRWCARPLWTSARSTTGRDGPLRHPRHPLVSKREDPGAWMSRGERRARIAASGPPIPIVGDVIQARQAARLSPEKYSRRTGAQIVGAGQAGGLAGNALGAGAALGLARQVAEVRHQGPRGQRLGRRQEARARPRSTRWPTASRSETSPMVQRAIAHRRTPQLVRTGSRRTVDSPLGRAVARNPKVAAIGALAGGAIGGPAATQAMLSHTMSRDDRYRKTMAKRAADKAGQADPADPAREPDPAPAQGASARPPRCSTGTTGIAALGTTLGRAALKEASSATDRLDQAGPQAAEGSAGPAAGHRRWRRRRAEQLQLRQHPAPGGAPGPQGAAGPPRIPGIRRAPAMRKGFLRQTRYPSGMVRTSTVRGGLA